MTKVESNCNVPLKRDNPIGMISLSVTVNNACVELMVRVSHQILYVADSLRVDDDAALHA